MRKNYNLIIYYYKTLTGWKAFYWGICHIAGYIESEEKEALKSINSPGISKFPDGKSLLDVDSGNNTVNRARGKLNIDETVNAKDKKILSPESISKVKGISIIRIKQRKKQVTVIFERRTDVTGYEVAYRQGKKGKYKKIRLASWKKNQVDLRKLKSGKDYYVKVRAFIQKDDKKYYSPYSKPKKFCRKYN